APQRRDHPRADASASGKAAEDREVPVERHYIGEARLAGGARIELGGIVYSEDHPVALVNGRILGPGSSIEGFTIVAIHEDRIELRASDRAIVISLR
ncbi:MAG TPA: hypothetical protein VIZ69_09845, partial [Thermoanaerobaculia bacterium]